MKYSLILPIYNEEESIKRLYRRLTYAMDRLEDNYEIIFVNDGSSDQTAHLLNQLQKENKQVKIINFSRNFGHQTAVTAGLNYAAGEIIAVLDADLQDPPEVLPLFFKKIHEGYDVVYAIRRNRKEKTSMRFMYGFFYRLLKMVANIDIPLDSGDFCVMRRKVVDAINSLPERNRFVRGLRSWVGYKQIGCEYERDQRYAGKSKYGMSKLMKLAFDGIFSFSYVPLQIMFYVGLGSLIISFIGSIIAVYMRFFTTAYTQVPGFATTIILIMFVGGLQLFSLGIMGEYMRRVYDEVKQRKPYIIESLVGFEK